LVVLSKNNLQALALSEFQPLMGLKLFSDQRNALFFFYWRRQVAAGRVACP
jgi:hypothetical protein